MTAVNSFRMQSVSTGFRVTPAMEAELTDHVWELEELAGAIG